MKNFKKIFFVLIAFGLILQYRGSGYLFAQTQDNEVPIVEDIDNKDDEDKVVGGGVEKKELEDNKDLTDESEVPVSAEAVLGDFILTFKDYKEELAQEAYVLTGKGTTGVITYNLIGEDPVMPNTLAFRLKFPLGSDVKLPENNNYKLSFGSEFDPKGVAGENDEFTYVWFTLISTINNAHTETITFNHVPDLPVGQLGTDDKVINIEMDAFALDGSSVTKLNKSNKAKIISYANEFSFNSVTSNFNLANQVVTTKTFGDLEPIIFRQTVTPRNTSNVPGLVHTKKITYTNTFTVDSSTDNNPYIKFKRNDILKLNGETFNNSELDVSTNSQGYVYKFTIITEVFAKDGEQLTNQPAEFEITNAKLDKDLVQNDFNLAVGRSKKVLIKNTEKSGIAYPVSKVSGLENNFLKLEIANISDTGATFTNASETGRESLDQAFNKRLISIADIKTIGSDMDSLSAYKNDIVVFDFATNWSNRQESKLDVLEIVESSDTTNTTGYNPEDLTPIRIKSGVASFRNVDMNASNASLDIIVEFSDGSSDFVKTYTKEELIVSNLINIPIDKQDVVKNIRFVYRNIDPKFLILEGPSIEFRVLGKDITKQGVKIKNKAKLVYKYKEIDEVKDSSEVYFRYRDIEVDRHGEYKSHKDAKNLSRDTFQEKDDVILFNIDIQNKKNTPVKIKTIFDEYTYNLSPYSGKNTVNNDPNSALIDESYIVDDVSMLQSSLNLVIWKVTTDSNNQTQLVKLDNQDVFESIEYTDTVDPNMDNVKITFADDGYELAPGEKIVLTYTMYTNAKFVKDATIGNKYKVSNINDELISKGEYWKVKPNDKVTDPIAPKTLNKKVVNASGTTLTEYPFINDILIYTITLKNDLTDDWTNISVDDTYTANLSPYNKSKQGISDKLFSQYGLNDQNLLNLDVNKDASGNLIMPAGFDPSKLVIELDEDTNSFTVSLGDNVIKPGEIVELSYTMRLNNTALAKQAIINKFTVSSNDEVVSRGHHNWLTNNHADSLGIVSNIKSVQGKADDGTNLNINRLVNGNVLDYTVTLSNYLPRESQVINVKNIFDYMPEYITYVENSIKLQTQTSILQSGTGTYKRVLADIDPQLYDVVYNGAENRIEIKFDDGFEQPGGIEGNNFERPINSVIITYKGLVNSDNSMFEDIDPNESRVTVENTAVAFYEEDITKLVAKSGTLAKNNDSLPYDDNDIETNSLIYSGTKMQVLNETHSFGWISKQVLENKDIDTLYDASGRSYSLNMYNTGFKNFGVTHVVDLLPDYEKIDTSKKVLLVDKKNSKEYEAIYKTDAVTIDDKTYTRLTVTGYIDNDSNKEIKLDGIKTAGDNNLLSITYSTIVNKDLAREDIYYGNTYEKSLSNQVAMYTSEVITLFKPQGLNVTEAYKRSTDNTEGDDWDSDINTDIRYETSVSVKVFTSAITPFMDVRAQIVEVSGSLGTTYRDAKDTDYTNPGDVLGWKVTIGNSNLDNTPVISAGTSIVVVIPDGLVFDGYSVDEKPEFLDEVQVNKKNSTLIWKTNVDIAKDDKLGFIFRTTTRSAYYEVYTVDGYMIPNSVPKFGFFNSKIYGSSEYNSYNSIDRRKKYSYEPEYGNLPTNFQGGSDRLHYLKASDNANVLGNLSIGGRMEVESLSDKTIKANTQVAPYFINLKNVNDHMKFSMILDVYKTGTGINDIVLINPLAGENDRFAIRDGARNSKGDIQLVNDGSFVVEKVNATSGALIEVIDSSKYSIQYTTQEHDYIFKNEDWEASNFDIWMDADEIIATGSDFSDVTATRTIIDDSVALNMNEAIKVSYIASLNNYYDSTWEANSSFAYGAYVDGVNSIHAETRTLSVKASIYSDRMKVVTDVLDPAKDPLRTNFELKLVEYSKSTGEELAVAPFTINVTNTNNGWLEDTTWLENLNRDSNYAIEAVSYDGYRTPTVEISSEKDPTGLTTWEAIVSYERIVYDEIEVNVEVVGDDKKSLENIDYSLNVLDSNNAILDTLKRDVKIANKSGNDFISTIETGNKYQIDIVDYSGFDASIELISEDTLDTTGIRYVYKITYTQQKDETVKPPGPGDGGGIKPPGPGDGGGIKPPGPGNEVKPPTTDGNNGVKPNNPGTSADASTTIFIITISLSLFVLLTVLRKRKHSVNK